MSGQRQSAGQVLLSVCIPTYNFGEFIGQTLETILPQVGDGVEVLILDGGSTDDTPAVIDALRERFPGLRYERRQERGGIDRDIALMVSMARGEYCWLFCSDDLMRADAVERVLARIVTGLDVYLCGFTLCALDMRPVVEHPILNVPHDAEYDLNDRRQRQNYFEHAQTTEAFFSFAGSVIVKRARWNAYELDERFVGSCWAHVARIFAMMGDGLQVGYLSGSYLDKRSGNDSFLDRGIVRRYALAIDGYHHLASTFFGEMSMETHHIHRVVANEFPLWVMLHAKAETRRSRPQDLPLLNRLAATAWAGTGLANRIKHGVFRLTPSRAYEWALACYRPLRAGAGLMRRSAAPQATAR